MTRNVHEFTSPPVTPVQSSGGNNGNGKALYSRVAVLEAALKHLAIKEGHLE